MNDTAPSTSLSSHQPLDTATHAGQDSIGVTLYGKELPPFLDDEMARLYGNIHSTFAHLRTYGGMDAITHAYVEKRQGAVTAIFLLERQAHAVRVINEGMRIDGDTLSRFAQHVFSSFVGVRMITFHAVQADIDACAFPLQRVACTANIVLTLPPSREEYLASLGKNMRRNLRRYMDKLLRSHPSFRYEVHEKEAVQEQHVRDILQLNRARIAGKNKSFAIDDEEEKIIALAKTCGMVGVATIDGRVCAGAVGYLVGDHYFFKIIAHDPQYNEFSAGILCCYLTICACIERGCKEYNFMWNEYEYKFALGAFRRELDHLVLYRSLPHMLLHPRIAVGTALAGYRHKASTLMEKAERNEPLPRSSLAALRALQCARTVKRMLTGQRRIR